MTRASYRFLDQAPPPVRSAVAAAESALGEGVRVFDPAPGQATLIGRSEHHFVRIAASQKERRRVLSEAARLEWAAGQAIPVPAITGSAPDGSWLATEVVPNEPPEGAAFVEAALRTCDAIASARPPRPGLLQSGRARRASRWSLPQRAARMRGAGIGLAEFATARRRAWRLPHDVLSHGDLHSGNVLFDPSGPLVRATDFELLGYAPAGTDPLTLWCGLDRADDRDALLAAVLDRTPASRRRALGHLHVWLALRTLADIALVPAPHRDREHDGRVAEAFDRVREAREHASRW